MLLVFDLDFTLWDCGGTWCDCTDPPYRKESGVVTDNAGRIISLYPDVPGILYDVKKEGHSLAAASRTHEPGWALKLLELLGVEDLFEYKEIYPGPKVPHFRELKRKSGFDYDQMIFFDDEMRNIKEISAMGVKSVYIENGLKKSHLNGLLD